jgi:hypothetical protein
MEKYHCFYFFLNKKTKIFFEKSNIINSSLFQ